MTAWPDTSNDDPPVDNPHAVAEWFLGRHPHLAALIDRIPGAVEDDPGPWLNLSLVGEAVRERDAHMAAMDAYRARNWEPPDDDEWEAWRAAGPQPTARASAVLHMSRTEQGRVRLLAFWCGERSGLSIHDLAGFDDAGRRLIADWCAAILAQ